MKIIIGVIVVFLLLDGCSTTKDISKEAPYNQCVGKKFVLKKDIYIFKFKGSSHYNIAAQDSGINELPRLVDQKYIRNNKYGAIIEAVVKKGTIFSIVKVIYSREVETSSVRFLIVFDDLSFTKNGIMTSGLINFKNPPYTQTWSDPPIFEAKFAEPLPSDGVWWK